MQKQSVTPTERRQALVHLLSQGAAASQQALVDALGAQGIEVTQTTLSRDLRELGAVKGPDGYAIPGGTADPLRKALSEWLTSAVPAQNLLVLRTPPGGAAPLAVVLDDHPRPEILGTVAGDDTILVVTAAPKVAAKLGAEFASSIGGPA